MTLLSGVLLLDKPRGWTSRETIAGVAERLDLGPVGHAGTLDPMATGLLVALVGAARRLQEFFSGRSKRYRARIRFGARSDTDDAEGAIAPGDPPAPVDRAGADAILARFVGVVMQLPPAYSALRVGGRRAYDLKRRGVAPPLSPREVVVHALELVAVEGDDWVVDVACGPGFYVRSLARDLGEVRGCGAYLAALVRTQSGRFDLADAVTPVAARRGDVLPLSAALSSEPRVDLGPDARARLSEGRAIPAPPGIPVPAFGWAGGEPEFLLMSPASGLLRSECRFRNTGQ